MAERLPKLIVLKSVSCGRYAKYMNENDKVRGSVYCEADSVFNTFAKIEVERDQKNGGKDVHLRFYHSNKYWGRGDCCLDYQELPVGFDWLVASSNQPAEDTLFEPCFSCGDGGPTLSFRHISSGKRVGSFSDPNDPTNINRLFLYPDIVDNSDSSSTACFVFTFVDWDTLVALPKRVAFKGDNGKYLQAYTTKDGWDHLQLGSDYVNDEHVPQEVELRPDGHVRIKCDYFGKHWRCNVENWILVNTNDDTPIKETLFWPVKVDGGRAVALRASQNVQFCKRIWISETRKDCLSATAPAVNNYAKLVVEELVLERCICNVRYRMEDARTYDVGPVVVGVGAVFNNSDREIQRSISVQYEANGSYTFSNGLFTTGGVKTTFQGGLPVINAQGSIGIGPEVTDGFEWGREVEELKSGEARLDVRIPPRTRATVSYVATRCRCSVPFSYTQRDKMRSGGSNFITSEHIDGIFNGVDYYNFRFEQPAFDRPHA